MTDSAPKPSSFPSSVHPSEQPSKSALSPGPPKPQELTVARLLKGNLLIFISTLFFGINVPFMKVLIPQWMAPMDMGAMRMAGGAILVWALSIFVETQPIQRQDRWRIFLCGAVMLFPFISLFALSLKFGSPIDISIILTLPALFVILIESIFYRKRITAMEIFGLVIAFGGAVLVIVSSGSRSTAHASAPLLGDLIAIASCVCYAFYLINEEPLTHRYNTYTIMRWVFLAGCVPGIPFFFHFAKDALFINPSSEALWFAAFVIVCASFLAYILIPPAIKMIGSELVSIYQYLLPVIATLACLVMKIDRLHWDQPVAMVVIVVGVFLVNRAKRKLAKEGRLLR